MTREETAPGQVLCFGSDEDSGCDVGTSIGLGDGKALWIGELLTRDGANMGFVFHGPDRERIVAPFADGTDWQEIAELFRHYIAPAIAKIADAEAAAMRERAADYIEGRGGMIPGATVFASLVSGNNQPCMSGDARDRLPLGKRRRFDDAAFALATAIRSFAGDGGGGAWVSQR